MMWIHYITELFYPSLYTSMRIDAIATAPIPYQNFVFSLFDYHSSEGKKLIYYIKKYNNSNVSFLLAKKMKEHLLEYLSEQNQFSYFLNPLIVTVPLSSQSIKIRGFNQNEKIARYFAQQISAEYIPHIIIKTKETQKQALLKHKTERISNIKNAFLIPESYKEALLLRDVIIIDDLVTSGATLCEMERILKKAGARKIIAITVAH